MIIKMPEPIVFKYFHLPHGLGGRGGVERFFLLANGIPFTEELVTMEYWGKEGKAKSLESGENPCGSLPILFVGEDKKQVLSQHIASSRYLARMHGVTKDICAYNEYVQDLVADEYAGFRAAWATAAFEGSDDDKKKYKEEALPQLLNKFDKLYAKYKTDDIYLSKSPVTDMPLWGDAALFGLLRDNAISGFLDLEEQLKTYPNLSTMYEAFGKIGPVQDWTDKNEQANV